MRTKKTLPTIKQLLKAYDKGEEFFREFLEVSGMEKLGEGCTAEVFAYGKYVVKVVAKNRSMYTKLDQVKPCSIIAGYYLHPLFYTLDGRMCIQLRAKKARGRTERMGMQQKLWNIFKEYTEWDNIDHFLDSFDLHADNLGLIGNQVVIIDACT